MLLEWWHFTRGNAPELLDQVVQHLYLTALSVVLACAISLPVALALARQPRAARLFLASTSVVQTIPSLAILGFLIPFVDIGVVPAVIVLVLYALLPIARNAVTGLQEVPSAVKEAAKGMGMSPWQQLFQVELPLALPTLFAGIRTATVITVGIATLCAFIGAGGLGKFIFRGISLNNSVMILGGAIPAAILALLLDTFLAIVQRNLGVWLRVLGGLAGAGALIWFSVSLFGASSPARVRLAMPPEFHERADGFRGLQQAYQLEVEDREMQHALLYPALKNQSIDAIIGFSTDGEINTFDLSVLEDDKRYFPPYEVCPVIREEAFLQYPTVVKALNRLHNQLNDSLMAALNAEVDSRQRAADAVAREFAAKLGYDTALVRSGSPDLVVGSKIFAEQYILAELFKVVIESETGLTVETLTGLGGTKICFEALRKGSIDVYPEYTGTGGLAILQPDSLLRQRLIASPDSMYHYVAQEFQRQYGLRWLKPLGANNTYAFIVRPEVARALPKPRISDWVHWSQSR